jgi:hypothetical protein
MLKPPITQSIKDQQEDQRFSPNALQKHVAEPCSARGMVVSHPVMDRSMILFRSHVFPHQPGRDGWTTPCNVLIDL